MERPLPRVGRHHHCVSLTWVDGRVMMALVPREPARDARVSAVSLMTEWKLLRRVNLVVCCL